MADYYVMTNWGPMKTHRCKNNTAEITAGAPEDMNTFLEVYTKYKELEGRLNLMGIGSSGNWLTTKVETLPQASENTINTIYIDNSGNSYITINKGTENAPLYDWIPFGGNSNEELWNKIKDLENIIIELLKKVLGTDDTTEAIDTFPEVYLFLSEFKNNQTLKEVASEINEVSEEDIDNLFTQDQNLEEGLS